MINKQVNIAIIGTGTFGRQHAIVIKKNSDCNLIAGCQRNEAKLFHFSNEFGIPGFKDYKDILKMKEIDAVVVVLPHHLHKSVAIEVANAGKHLLLEKPMALTPSECEMINIAFDLAGKHLMIGHNIRYFRSSQIAKTVIQSGELGEIIYSTAVFSKAWKISDRHDWHKKKATGGGMLMTVGIHYIDLLIWLFESNVSSVSANLRTVFSEQEADDAGILYLNFKNSKSCAIISTGYETGVQQAYAELTCTKGILKIDLFKGVYIGRNETWTLIPESISEEPEREALAFEWEAFVEMIMNDKESPISGSYGKHIIEIILAAQLSSDERREIYIS